MPEFETYRGGEHPPGTVVVQLVRSGDEVQAFVREVSSGDDSEQTVKPSEFDTPQKAFRLARNKIDRAGQPVLVELEAGVEWNPDWGDLR